MRALAIVGLLVACDPSPPAPSRDPAPAREATREASDEETADEEAAADEAPTCRLEPAFASHEEPGLGDVIAVARSSRGALVAASRGEGHVLLDVGERALSVRDGTIDGALVALEPYGEGEYLGLSTVPCRDGRTARCLSARVAGSTTAIELPSASSMRTLRVASTDGLVYLARSYRDGGRATLDRFGPGPDGIRHEALRVGDGLLPEEPVEILALSADGAAYALVYRHGASEDPESGVVLATQLDEHHVAELHDALVVESMTWVGTSIAMLAAFEFARPAYLRLAPDGEVRSAPREVPFGIAPPDPFASRLVARAQGTPGALELEVRNAAGDRFGELVPLPGARAVDLALEPGGFLVAWTDGASVFVAHLRC